VKGMNRNIKLTEGNIFKTLIRLALPLMGTSFIQMAYSLTDIMWLGRLSTEAVAAAGAVGFLTWFGSGLILMSQIGVGVNVAQSYGRGDIEEARKYAGNGLRFDLLLGVLYSLSLFIFRNQIIGFFNLDSIIVYDMAIQYLKIICIGLMFSFMNPVFSNILNSTGDSMTPFKVNTIGLIFNMILDPMLIFGFGPVPAMGIRGAALATITAQIIVSLTFMLVGRRNLTLYSNLKVFKKLEMDYVKNIVKIGYPGFLQTSLQALISMVLARMVAAYGAVGIAVQSIGTQIESLSWMTAEGFSSAISAFVGQNYGAKKYDRIADGYKEGMKIVGSIGLLASFLLIFASEPIFSKFVPNDPAAIEEGVRYLVILGFSQFFMSIEIGTAGLFNGLGRTMTPAIVGVIFNSMRIPIALILSRTFAMGLSGIWWSISATGIIKGIIMSSIFLFIVRPKLLNGEI